MTAGYTGIVRGGCTRILLSNWFLRFYRAMDFLAANRQAIEESVYFDSRCGTNGGTSITGTPKRYEDTDTTSGNPVRRYFGGNCGSPIYSALPAQPDTVFLKTGTLDDTTTFKPMFQAWCDSKQNWVTLEEGAPAMATQ